MNQRIIKFEAVYKKLKPTKNSLLDFVLSWKLNFEMINIQVI